MTLNELTIQHKYNRIIKSYSFDRNFNFQNVNRANDQFDGQL